MDMVVLDSLIVFLTSYNGIVLYDKPTGMKDSCLFKPSGFSVYGTEKKHIENVKVSKLCNYISSITHQNSH